MPVRESRCEAGDLLSRKGSRCESMGPARPCSLPPRLSGDASLYPFTQILDPCQGCGGGLGQFLGNNKVIAMTAASSSTADRMIRSELVRRGHDR